MARPRLLVYACLHPFHKTRGNAGGAIHSSRTGGNALQLPRNQSPAANWNRVQGQQRIADDTLAHQTPGGANRDCLRHRAGFAWRPSHPPMRHQHCRKKAQDHDDDEPRPRLRALFAVLCLHALAQGVGTHAPLGASFVWAVVAEHGYPFTRMTPAATPMMKNTGAPVHQPAHHAGVPLWSMVGAGRGPGRRECSR